MLYSFALRGLPGLCPRRYLNDLFFACRNDASCMLLQAEGNDLFKAANFDAAISKYSQVRCAFDAPAC